ncbi:MAG: energy-coupled thiamine transporter ThiT [Oscillospiraceae bacterium]|nr:energy-coupled thiamine transporter ThiT [Oscillospiraceae bacterium]
MENRKTFMLAESGVLLALGLALSYFKIGAFWAYGGSITPASMLPIVFLAYKYGVRWGIGCGFVHGVLQLLLQGLGDLPSFAKTPGSFFAVIVLDFLVAFAVVGLAGIFKDIIKNPAMSIIAGSILGVSARFVCHFIIGAIVWGEYAPEDWSAVLYSFVYNIGYMGPEIVITSVAAGLLIGLSYVQNRLETEN